MVSPKRQCPSRASWLAALLPCLSSSLVGCEGGDSQVVDEVLDRRPGVTSRPIRATVTAQPTGEPMPLGRLALVAPEGWVVKPRRGPGEGVWIVRMRCTHPDGVANALVRVSESEKPWLATEREGLVKVARLYNVPDPRAFANRYGTDLEFWTAVYNATPQERDAARGARRNEVRTLLRYKIGSRRPSRRLAAPGLQAIIIYPPRKRYASAMVFDKGGNAWVHARLEVSDPTPGEADPGTLLTALLANSHFRAGREQECPDMPEAGAEKKGTKGNKGVRNLCPTGRAFWLAFCPGLDRVMPCPGRPGPRQAESSGDGAACGGGPAAMPTSAVCWPPDWLARVNRPQTRQEREALALCIARGRPFGSPVWVRRMAARFGLESTLRPRGRPRKNASKP